MPQIPDSIGLTEQGLSAESQFLGSPSVVDGLIRELLNKVVTLRGEQLAGARGEIGADVGQACEQFQATFYGRNPAFTAGPWFSEHHLGRALVEGAEMGGEAGDAVYRLALRMVNEFLGAYLPFEAGDMSDDDFKWRVDATCEFYQAALMGLPYDADEG